ncbi:uncharacterized protein N7484_005312 [Penicillium longicatenatum]|uniref:uncharacterized protein n=1 Tax=Penicillium longicatenatum TaxID=1561947 RepID=UPI002547F89E|nr:uncharacterized protein N7484_005312 [Penicillium longicatenatum]KAJ5651589.1 hypothetical protein N7484_005312 [Penicillium longicatenatum]
MPIIRLLDFYFCLWDSYVELQESNEWLEVENDLLVQRCNEQALMMWSRERVLRELHAGIAVILKASGETAFPTDIIIESDFDLDLYAIWRESSGILTPPPCLAADYKDYGLGYPPESMKNHSPPPLLIECLFHFGLDDAPGFN